ncbi:hydrolase [Luteibacter sahnii]|uniref:hydrolase n=1 Tax=Luteibacter sahnii TaxID=3021977 RepID=UPI002A69CDF8|nr:hydrolase [Luteibacter sp. PPL193]MDY1547558.1 hydrolase [Luteibacter sp. PPL193]
MPFNELITPARCALALVDFQPAMFQGVQSHDRKLIMDNARILARAARLFDVPVVLTTVAKDSFSGPFMPEVTDGVFPGHPVIDRTSINAWLNDDFRRAVAATGRRRIVIAGLWTGACVNFPTLDMLREGYEVIVVTDACGDTSAEAHERAVQRMIQAGAIPMTALQFVFELQQDWARSGTYEGVMDILRDLTPYGIQVRFSKWALGEHASEAG